ncbi:hypothetical protein ABB37_08237 [Leptomonas pyrrhocoris]|uniref:Uncharacterized protein n=1 Tax=Leptomonas pyrrhocoris TaxID=157538 RepID=A0A0M9FTQ1_LEPPY|nr:hypothetical protein ABB37_08237 [Leptomonas pyrrhocoris]KPA75676.1 hypothetical protein ABB37_08237 [Leptomonas pyrrhocoris]|eukprot:XP_015654115.1 hypothetical protein ABB37_08237 [Leptomonas pyrrhocoris]
MPSQTSSQDHETPPLPARPAGSKATSSRRSSYGMLLSGRSNGGAQATAALRQGASHNLPSSVGHFLRLCSAPNSAAARKELRRQLLLLRDHCVGVNNRIKGAELLSQGGRGISKKVEARADFNSCLHVIFATSFVFADETEDIAKDTLRDIIAKLKVAEDCGDETAFRAAIIEVVNSVLLCNPLIPAVKAAVEHEETAEERHKQQEGEDGADGAAEPQLEDDCLDFLTVEDGVPVLLESQWRHWLDYFEEGYLCYVEKLIEEQKHEQADAAAAAAAAAPDAEADAEEEEADGDAATAAVPVIESVPILTAHESYWRSTRSAYAQFSYLLLAIFFVRTKDFSLNYLARVHKLVQYYAYQLDSAAGEPIAVKEADDADPEKGDEEAEVSHGNDASVQTAAPEPEEAAEKQVEEHREEEVVGEAIRTLPQPEFDESVTRRTRHSTRRSVLPEHTPSMTVAPEPSRTPRRRTHRCFATEELPQELRPSAEAVREEEEEATDKDAAAAANSHVPSVRRTTRLDIAEVSSSRQRENAKAEGAMMAMEDTREEAAVAKAQEELEEAAEGERVARNVEDLRNEAAVEALAKEADAHDEVEELARDAEQKKDADDEL